MRLPEWFTLQAGIKPDLFRAIVDFNLRPQLWMHPDRLAALPHAAVLRSVEESPEGSRLAGRWVIQGLGFTEEEAEWDFTEKRRRLALLPYSTLERLVRHVGAVLHWEFLTKVLVKHRIRQIQEEIGADAFSFAIRRGRTLAPSSLAMPKGGNHEILESGWTTCVMALEGNWSAITTRFRLKIPPQFDLIADLEFGESAAERSWALVERVAREVLTTKERECYF